MDQFFAYYTHTIAHVNGVKNCFAVVAASVVRSVGPTASSFFIVNGVRWDLCWAHSFRYFGLSRSRYCCLFSSALCLVLFVERAKKCLDFGVTLYFIDFLIHCFYLVRTRTSCCCLGAKKNAHTHNGRLDDAFGFLCGAGVSQEMGLVARASRGSRCDYRFGGVPVLSSGAGRDSARGSV